MEPGMRLWHTSSVVILPQKSLKTLSSWRDDHTTISSCYQPISELHTDRCPGHKALLVPDSVVLHHVYKIKSLLIHNFQKSIYPSFITIFIKSYPYIVPLFVHRNLWLYIMVLVQHWNTVQQSICVHTASWALSDGGTTLYSRASFYDQVTFSNIWL